MTRKEIILAFGLSLCVMAVAIVIGFLSR